MNTVSAISARGNIVVGKAFENTFLVTSFVIMTALGAYIRIPLPFTPVPITLQTFFVLLCGAVLGKKIGSLTQASYVALGALGLPVFQGYGSGLLHLAGPTGGYLVGFMVAAFLVGHFVKRGALLAMITGLLAIYACGILWLIAGYGFDPAKAVSLGFIPFIPGAILKLIAASWIYSKVKSKI